MKDFAISASVLALTTAAIATPAYAQGAAESQRSAAETTTGAPEVDVVIVTARKREEKVQDVPVSITAYSATTLERAGVKTFEGLALNNPNVKIQPISSTGLGRSVAIRGNVQSSSGLSVDPSVGVYIDGHLLAHSYANAGLTVDLVSVQTLKGPQGTLFGRNTTGGALLVQTVDPRTDEISGYAQAETGTVGLNRFGAAINVPLGDVAAVRLVYQNNQSGDYEKFTTGLELGRKRDEVFRAKVLVRPTDSLDVIFTSESTKERVHSTLQTSTQPNDPLYKNVPLIAYTSGPLAPGTSPVDARAMAELATLSSQFYGIRATQQVASGNIKFIASKRHYGLASASTVSPQLGFTFQNKPSNDETAVELQYNGTLLNNRVELASGLFYFKEDVHERQNTFLYAGPQRTTRIQDATTESYSAYTQATVHVTDALNVTGGLRYTHDEKKGVLHASTRGAVGNADGTPATALALTPATKELKASRVNYLISADYTPVDGVMLYVSHATGYRSGGLGVDRLSDAVTLAGGVPNPAFTIMGSFNPESVKNYEVGFKTELLERMLTFNGSAFYQKYSNYQYNAINPISVQRETKNTDAVIKGFELEAKLRVHTGTTFSGSYGYTDAKTDGATFTAPGSGVVQVPDNHPLSYIPKRTYSISLTQNFEIAGGYLDLVANYSRRASFFSALPDLTTPFDEVLASTHAAVGLLNLSATYENGPYTLALFADNVTNEHYFTNITVSTTAVNLGSLGMPRVIGLRGRYKF